MMYGRGLRPMARALQILTAAIASAFRTLSYTTAQMKFY